MIAVEFAGWQRDVHCCADGWRTCERERAVARVNPVKQSREAGSVSGVSVAAAVVTHLDRQSAAFAVDRDGSRVWRARV
jgi:hypothetical protein